MRCLSLVDKIFDDKRLGIGFLFTWLIIVITVFYNIGLLSDQYMNIGPSNQTVFMHIVLDTWYKWGMVALFTALNTCINDFMSDAISPWLLNTVTDHKTQFLPYPKIQCLLISQMWTMYCGIMGVIGVMIILSQVDFVLIRLFCDLMVSFYTNYKFMQNKIYDRHRYYEMHGTHHDPDMCTEGSACEVCNVHLHLKADGVPNTAANPGKAEIHGTYTIDDEDSMSSSSRSAR